MCNMQSAICAICNVGLHPRRLDHQRPGWRDFHLGTLKLALGDSQGIIKICQWEQYNIECDDDFQ